MNKKGEIMAYKSIGWSARKIGRQIKRSNKVVSAYLNDPENYGHNYRDGRKPVLSEREKRVVLKDITKPSMSLNGVKVTNGLARAEGTVVPIDPMVSTTCVPMKGYLYVNVRRILHFLYMHYILLNANTGPILSAQTVCEFNRLCFCSNYTSQLSEVTCLGVNVRLSELPNNGHFYRIRIIGAPDLAQIGRRDLAEVRSLSSLVLSRNRLSAIDSQAFAHFPHLYVTQCSQRAAPKSVIHDNTFTELSSLEFLDLDDNMISRLEGTPFPSTLITLSMSNCLLQEVPIESVANLRDLQILQLRGNLIRHLPHMKFATQNLQMLDLSHNLISTITDNVFAFSAQQLIENLNNPLKYHKKQEKQREDREGRDGRDWSASALKYSTANTVNTSSTSSTVRIMDLHLDFNFIQSLPSGLFGHMSCERLSLSNNRIASQFISEQAFDGPLIHELKALDLNYNLIDSFPNALKSLQNIRQLLLKNNRINSLDDNSFANCSHSLEVLDLSRNLMRSVPAGALAATKRLLRLSLYDNLITRVDDNDLGVWAQTLLSLSLSKNAIKYISGDAFRHAKNLRELRLGGNRILHASPYILTPMLALEVLELSDALNYVNSGPVVQSADIGSLSSLKWLQLDYNGLKRLPFSLAMNAFKSLIHCDLESNQIAEISSEFAGSANLSSVILSRNQLSVIKSHTFDGLPLLENIALYLNHIHAIESNAFKDLPKLKTIILSKNSINRIEWKAFVSLGQSSPSLSLLLDENRLKCFSADIFGSMGTKGFLYINVSHNEIKHLSGCTVGEPSEQLYANSNNSEDNNNYDENNITVVSGGDQSIQTLNVRVLDLSFNQIQDIPNAFIEIMCQSLHSLHLNHNRVIVFPIRLLQLCPQLQILMLNNNFITETVNFANETAFVTELQVLGLRHNRIQSIVQFVPIFQRLRNLRVLDLTHNYIQTLPVNGFAGTGISRLHLSHNHLIKSEMYNISAIDTENSCWGVSETLTYLDLSHNYLTSAPIEVMSCENLIEVSFAHNLVDDLSVLSMRSVAHKFISLRQMDFSHNPIKRIDNKSFIMGAQNMNCLKLNNASLTAMPVLQWPHLTHLEVSHNAIATIDPQSMTVCREIRHLDLSHNHLQDVPRYLWKYMSKLHTLLIQNNPIDILDTSSFSELKNLRHLDIRGLNLQYIDTRLLHNHRRVHIVYKPVTRKPPKLKELIITGKNLIKILPDAFLDKPEKGLYNTHDLTLRVTDTNISSLPSGLLKYLADIRFITIDLRKNKLKSLKPDVFLVRSENKLNKNWESQQMLGGILLDENPLNCDCDLIWISDWMKRLISDMRVVNIEAALQAHTMASMSQCISYDDPIPHTLDNISYALPQNARKISLLDLRSEDIFCGNISFKVTSNDFLIIESRVGHRLVVTPGVKAFVKLSGLFAFHGHHQSPRSVRLFHSHILYVHLSRLQTQLQLHFTTSGAHP
ncbi:unnamed protein product [Medioppia subpectinata]|uniref:Chaoptin n=1 Tax=Medioppia subpectinata TaxID=1979941 RepID=A0A7R9KJ45_9ACAR|nr:unnamed protein product [Medioppia subpectinata]CAG2103122.1 unnamed protein product [Medioppia subpectinata]